VNTELRALVVLLYRADTPELIRRGIVGYRTSPGTMENG